MKKSILQRKSASFDFPVFAWRILQLLSVFAVIVCIAGLLILPKEALFLIWNVLIPVIPLLLFVAPGLWRNLCPIATISQLPKMTGAAGTLPLSSWLVAHSGIISIFLFLLIVSLRKILFNDSAIALAFLLIAVLLIAMYRGAKYKGKSGWCTSICPMLPVERLYGQVPFVDVAHRHCQPCVGCTKHCSDIKPQKFYLSTLNNRNKRPDFYLVFFASIFPGFILAYYLSPTPETMSDWQEIGHMYVYFLVFCSTSASIFFFLQHVLQLNKAKIITLYGAAALNIYYGFNASLLASHFPLDIQKEVDIFIRVLVGVLSLLWIIRSYNKHAAASVRSSATINVLQGKDSANKLRTS